MSRLRLIAIGLTIATAAAACSSGTTTDQPISDITSPVSAPPTTSNGAATIPAASGTTVAAAITPTAANIGATAATSTSTPTVTPAAPTVDGDTIEWEDARVFIEYNYESGDYGFHAEFGGVRGPQQLLATRPGVRFSTSRPADLWSSTD